MKVDNYCPPLKEIGQKSKKNVANAYLRSVRETLLETGSLRVITTRYLLEEEEDVKWKRVSNMCDS
jgi:ribonucleotide reductase alpha subunit